MSTACSKFFDIPELLDLVTMYLDKKDILNFVLTSRRMHRLVMPTLYREVVVHHTSECRMFTSFPALHALARNIQHIRMLLIGVNELAYFYNCELAFEELKSWTKDTSRSRPSWQPPPDIRSCQIVALPPITRLWELKLYMIISETYPYTVRSVKSPRATLSQLCWLLSLNPGLAMLTLYGVPILDHRGSRLFGGAIAGLSNLKSLVVWIHCRSKDWSQMLTYAFISCRPSIQKLSLIVEPYKTSLRPHDTMIEDKNEEWWKRDEDLAPLIRTHEQLISLADLTLQGPRKFVWKSTSVLHSLFSNCPNIRRLELDINIVAGKNDINSLGYFIGQECPKIMHLCYGSVDALEHDPLGFRILDSLPSQQVITFHYSGVLSAINIPSLNASVLQHSTSLREIRLTGTDGHCYISASAILKECRNLEELCIPFLRDIGLFIPLDDALEHPWGCSKLTHLTLAISGCELPDEPGVQPYYHRPTPITLTEDEILHFARLEELYKRIGGLKELQNLDLRMPSFDEAGEVDTDCFDDPMSFPAMLSLEDVRRGRPGFLQHLSGLKKLETLRGSVSALSFETEVTMEWPEVAVGIRDFRIFETLPALHALARNTKYVRILDIGITELAYYYNCVLAFEQKLQSQTTTDSLQPSGLARSPPARLPPADNHSCQIVALPPMTRLFQLDITIGPINEKSYSVPSVKDFRARLAQTCWLISQNPGLVSLTLSGTPILECCARRLAETLAGLSRLETLVLYIRCRIHYWLEIWRQLFFCLPSSIRKVTMDFKENGNAWQFEHVSAVRRSEERWYLEEREVAVGVMEWRKEPLDHLEELSFRGMRGHRWQKTVDLAAMLAHCPNLKKFDAHLQIWNQALDVEAVARLIAEACPKIEVLVLL